MELSSRTMVVRAVEEFDADHDRVTLREQSAAGAAGSAPMMSGGMYSFTVAREDAPKVLDEVTVTVSIAS